MMHTLVAVANTENSKNNNTIINELELRSNIPGQFFYPYTILGSIFLWLGQPVAEHQEN
jgi:hypothetical protein